jgi:hypothetical protein
MNFIQKNVIGVLVIVALASAGSGYYFYHRYQELQQNPQAVAEKDNAALVAELSKLIVLPTDEQPTIATVADPSKLKDQLFFANAKTGDRVIIYTNARKAILYDPVAKQIIEVAPINIGR